MTFRRRAIENDVHVLDGYFLSFLTMIIEEKQIYKMTSERNSMAESS